MVTFLSCRHLVTAVYKESAQTPQVESNGARTDGKSSPESWEYPHCSNNYNKQTKSKQVKKQIHNKPFSITYTGKWVSSTIRLRNKWECLSALCPASLCFPLLHLPVKRIPSLGPKDLLITPYQSTFTEGSTGIYQKLLNARTQIDVCTMMFTVALVTIAKGNLSVHQLMTG